MKGDKKTGPMKLFWLVGFFFFNFKNKECLHFKKTQSSSVISSGLRLQ